MCHKKATRPQKGRQGPKSPNSTPPRPGAVNREHAQREEKANAGTQKRTFVRCANLKRAAPGSRYFRLFWQHESVFLLFLSIDDVHSL